jgi:hypothetical protein
MIERARVVDREVRDHLLAVHERVSAVLQDGVDQMLSVDHGAGGHIDELRALNQAGNDSARSAAEREERLVR